MRPPITIMIASALWALLALVAVRRVGIPSLDAGRDAFFAWLVGAGGVAMGLYYAVANWRLSRWPIVVYLVMVAINLAATVILKPAFYAQRYPILGVFVIIIPVGIMAALVLPHWKKMSWALFGGVERKAPPSAEVFS